MFYERGKNSFEYYLCDGLQGRNHMIRMFILVLEKKPEMKYYVMLLKEKKIIGKHNETCHTLAQYTRIYCIVLETGCYDT